MFHAQLLLSKDHTLVKESRDTKRHYLNLTVQSLSMSSLFSPCWAQVLPKSTRMFSSDLRLFSRLEDDGWLVQKSLEHAKEPWWGTGKDPSGERSRIVGYLLLVICMPPSLPRSRYLWYEVLTIVANSFFTCQLFLSINSHVGRRE